MNQFDKEPISQNSEVLWQNLPQVMNKEIARDLVTMWKLSCSQHNEHWKFHYLLHVTQISANAMNTEKFKVFTTNFLLISPHLFSSNIGPLSLLMFFLFASLTKFPWLNFHWAVVNNGLLCAALASLHAFFSWFFPWLHCNLAKKHIGHEEIIPSRFCHKVGILIAEEGASLW